LSEEELFSGSAVAGDGSVRARRSQRVNQGREGIEFVAGQSECRHTWRWNPVADEVPQTYAIVFVRFAPSVIDGRAQRREEPCLLLSLGQSKATAPERT
jgi:hypothetical protein